jgi:hypothetical protein
MHIAQGTVLFAYATNGILNDKRNCPHTPCNPTSSFLCCSAFEKRLDSVRFVVASTEAI